jgi:hypothetical protein
MQRFGDRSTQAPSLDPQRREQRLEDALGVVEIELALLAVHVTADRSSHDRGHHFDLLHRSIRCPPEPEHVPDLEQRRPSLAPRGVAGKRSKQVRDQAGPQVRLVAGRRVGHANRPVVAQHLEVRL